jgi:uncharacterized protein YwgA
MNKKENDILDGIILYIVTKLRGGASRTRIVKLLYLIDYFSSKKLGSKITKVNYNYYYYGPYSPVIADKIQELKSKGVLVESEVENSFGEKSFLYDVVKPKKDLKDLLKDSKKTGIIDEVIEKYGQMNFKQLLEFVYSTPPVEKNKQGTLAIL